MKFKKVTSLLLVGAMVSGLMVGCTKNETDKSNRLIEMRKKEVTEEKVDKNVEDKEDENKTNTTNTKKDTKEKQESKTKTKNSQSNTKKEEVKQDNGYEYDDDGTVLNKKYGDHLEEEAQKQDAEEEVVEGDEGEAWHEHDDDVGNDDIGYIGESNGVTVYVNLDSGKFHKSANAHDMDGAVEMTRDDAEASGYSPCGNCYR